LTKAATPVAVWNAGRPREARPVTWSVVAYKRRNVVERGFNTFKQWRALATRYDKLALTYRADVVLPAVVLWLTALGDTP